jgi:hypothetical protein
MPSLSYSELVGLLIAGAVVLYPLTQTEPAAGPARTQAAPVDASSTASGSHAQYMCPRTDGR